MSVAVNNGGVVFSVALNWVVMETQFLAVLDFEATCDDGSAIDPPFDTTKAEIIEFPVALIDLSEARVVDSFNAFVRPTVQPQLTSFCTELTSITQEQVDDAQPIAAVLSDFLAWLERHGARYSTLIATCGDWDLNVMWPRQRQHAPDLVSSELFRRWCNLKTIFRELTGIKSKGMMHMLAHFQLGHVGHHHRGADDVRNLANLALKMLSEGAEFKATGSHPAGL